MCVICVVSVMCAACFIVCVCVGEEGGGGRRERELNAKHALFRNL